jgi:hypothetical protein
MMVVKSKLDVHTLAALGADKLAKLVLDEAGANPAFNRRVAAALASQEGPEAVASIVDRRLSGLERARGAIDWDDTAQFAVDLRSLVDVIGNELGKLDPDAAIDRFVRFLATAGKVFDRVDDSHGHVQNVFRTAAEAIPGLAAALSTKRKASLPGRLHELMVDDGHGFGSGIFETLLPSLSQSSVASWNERFAGDIKAMGGGEDKDWGQRLKLDRLIRLREAIADHRGDCDAFIALECARPRPDGLAIAERLLNAKRYGEALEWVRKPSQPRVRIVRLDELRQGFDPKTAETIERVCLELSILEAKGDRREAQEMRWRVFEETLEVTLLRDYVAKLGDFEEFDALDRAFACASAFKDRHRALDFFLSWPRVDLAAKLILDHKEQWDGRCYDELRPAAEALEHGHAAAATVLYRALLDRILEAGKSNAYGHGARYLSTLDSLASRIPDEAGIPSHETYRAEVQKKHGRKHGFWAQVESRRR